MGHGSAVDQIVVLAVRGIHFGAVHSADVRVGIALLGSVVFATAASTRWRRAIPVLPVVVLCLIVAGWLFGATLVWGTGYATKVRWAASWTHNGHAWQWTAILAVALIGVLCLGLAMRAFARRAPQPGWILSAMCGAAFIAWSAVVRYSVVAAVFVFDAGAIAVASVGRRRLGTVGASKSPAAPQLVAVPLLLAAIALGFAWAFYAFVWLVVGPEGRQSCNCWADHYNDWQYQAEFLVALGGALGLLAATAAYVKRRRDALRATSIFTGAAVCAWIAFAITGSAQL